MRSDFIVNLKNNAAIAEEELKALLLTVDLSSGRFDHVASEPAAVRSPRKSFALLLSFLLVVLPVWNVYAEEGGEVDAAVSIAPAEELVEETTDAASSGSEAAETVSAAPEIPAENQAKAETVAVSASEVSSAEEGEDGLHDEPASEETTVEEISVEEENDGGAKGDTEEPAVDTNKASDAEEDEAESAAAATAAALSSAENTQEEETAEIQETEPIETNTATTTTEESVAGTAPHESSSTTSAASSQEAASHQEDTTGGETATTTEEDTVAPEETDTADGETGTTTEEKSGASEEGTEEGTAATAKEENTAEEIEKEADEENASVAAASSSAEENPAKKTEDGEAETPDNKSPHHGEAASTDGEASDTASEEAQTKDKGASAADATVIDEEGKKALKYALEKLEEEFHAQYEEKIRELEAELVQALVRAEQTPAPQEEDGDSPLFSRFDEKECTEISPNELHCLKRDGFLAPGSPDDAFVGVFAQTDEEEGDYELYLQRGEHVIRLTDNDYDDVNPAVDAENRLVAWQALIDDRWQIMVRNMTSGETSELTDGGENSINPSVIDGAVAWQSWRATNWEIFYAEQTFDASGASAWELRRITENDVHDVRPSAGGTLLLWESFQNGEWHIIAYDVELEKTFKISRTPGKHENPRLVILWEHKEGGNVETLQYDLKDGTVSKLGAASEKPAPRFPEDVPEPYKNKAALPTTQDGRSTTTPSGRPGEE